MSPIDVKDIEKNSENKTITVKILRMWIPMDAQRKPVSMETIMMDCEGTKIAGYVKRALLTGFRRMLREGDTVEITDFGVDDNPPTKWHKARVNHPFKVLFNYTTRVTKCKPDFAILSNGVNLIPFDDIPGWKNEFFIDIIGRVSKIGEVQYVEKARARKIDIEVQDERNTTLTVVLWESYADRLLATAPNGQGLEAIIKKEKI